MAFEEQSCLKKKIVLVMGATGTGKSRLSIDLAVHFSAEIINSDKIQVHEGLDILTNKLPESERRGVPHHLLGEIHPDADFTIDDFCQRTLEIVDAIAARNRVPIIVGGSNNYIQAFVESVTPQYKCIFIWLDVEARVIHERVSKRVDEMVEMGMVEEVRSSFVRDADYDRGIRRAIGVKELSPYMHAVEEGFEEGRKEALLRQGIQLLKANTCDLVDCQVAKIRRLRDELGWSIHRIVATHVFEVTKESQDGVWEELVFRPSLELVETFLEEEKKKDNNTTSMIKGNEESGMISVY